MEGFPKSGHYNYIIHSYVYSRLELIMSKNLSIIPSWSTIENYETVNLCKQSKINFTLAETFEIQVIQQDAVGEGELYHPDACTH